MKKALPVLLISLALTTTACSPRGDQSGQTTSADGRDATHGHDATREHLGSVPGEPADPSDADSQVVVVASDDLRFDPASLEVTAGEVVSFLVRNEGNIEHEFVLGDGAYQKNHEQVMQNGDHPTNAMDNGVTVAPNETATITWNFNEVGQILYGCHEPGHYDGGMVGTITVG